MFLIVLWLCSLASCSRHGTSASLSAAGQAPPLAPSAASRARPPITVTPTPDDGVLRFVTAENGLAFDSFRVDKKRRIVSRQAHHIGSGASRFVQVGLSNLVMPADPSQSFGPGNAVAMLGCYAFLDGHRDVRQLTFGGARTLQLRDAEPVVWSDPIRPHDLGLAADEFAHGTRLMLTVDLLVDEGQRYPFKLHNHFGNGAEPGAGTIRLNPESTTVTNLTSPGRLAWVGEDPTPGNAPPLLVAGMFTAGDAPVFGGFGDSILHGIGDFPATDDGLAFGAFQLALWPSNIVRGLPLAGCLFARPSGLGSVWASSELQAAILPLAKLCNRFVEQYGTNRISEASTTWQATVAHNEAVNLWAFLHRATVPGGMPIRIARTSLLMRVTGPCTALLTQTPTAGWRLGTDAAVFQGLVRASRGQPRAYHDYIEWSLPLRAAADPSRLDHWRWLPRTSDDGLHPSDLGYDALAWPLRAWMHAQ